MGTLEIAICIIVGSIAIVCLYAQAKMVDEVKKDERKRGYR